jgi:hypothetical protein
MDVDTDAGALGGGLGAWLGGAGGIGASRSSPQPSQNRPDLAAPHRGHTCAFCPVAGGDVTYAAVAGTAVTWLPAASIRLPHTSQ